jgi:glycosyltransferase involved in cell wall biosynthesis
MRAWLVKVGEPIQMESGGDRLFRTGTVAKILSERGHQVVWWTSTFFHGKKEHYFQEHTTLQRGQRYAIKLIHSRGYKKNISFDRYLDDCELARNFRDLAAQEEKPDVILCSFPTPMLAAEVARYARANQVPMILDIRDFWPDIILYAVPKPARPLARLFLSPLYNATRYACANATVLTGITYHFVDFACRHGHRRRTENDIPFHLAYERIEYTNEQIEEARAFWAAKGIEEDRSYLTLCYFGVLTRRFAFDTVIEAAKLLESRGRKARFIICGTGDALEGFKEHGKDVPSVIFAGWANGPQMRVISNISDLGLAPYFPDPDFNASFPNKLGEYMANDLPVVSSLNNSYSSSILDGAKCGVFFEYDKPETLAATLEKCMDSPSLLKQMAVAAPKLYDQHFMAAKVYSQMADQVERVSKMIV